MKNGKSGTMETKEGIHYISWRCFSSFCFYTTKKLRTSCRKKSQIQILKITFFTVSTSDGSWRSSISCTDVKYCLLFLNSSMCSKISWWWDYTVSMGTLRVCFCSRWCWLHISVLGQNPGHVTDGILYSFVRKVKKSSPLQGANPVGAAQGCHSSTKCNYIRAGKWSICLCVGPARVQDLATQPLQHSHSGGVIPPDSSHQCPAHEFQYSPASIFPQPPWRGQFFFLALPNNDFYYCSGTEQLWGDSWMFFL